MITNSHINDLNKRLASTYGKSLSGQPLFRLVFSNDLYETRIGTYSEFYGSIFLREFCGAKKVPKYSYIKDRWILEQFTNSEAPKEIINYDFYECLYVFEDKFGRPLSVVWRVLELIIFHVLHRLDAIHIKQLLDDAQMKVYKDEINYFEDMLSNSMNANLSKLHWGETVLIHRENN